MEPQIKKVKIEELTEEAFGPFGDILGPKERPPDWKSKLGPPNWFADFSVEGTVRVGFASNPYRKPPTEYVFSLMEQHRTVTQSLIPMGGKPTIVTVGLPTPYGTNPDVEKIRAFFLDGTRGVVLSRLTWHNKEAPFAFPIYPPGLDYVILHEVEIYEDITSGRHELTYEVDLKETSNALIQLTW